MRIGLLIIGNEILDGKITDANTRQLSQFLRSKNLELEMSMRAYLLLKEEYPMSAAFIKPIPDTGKYYFKANVQSFQAPGRFVMGFLEEVQVLGSKEFIRFIQKVVKKNT
jgi:hypothetical protein